MPIKIPKSAYAEMHDLVQLSEEDFSLLIKSLAECDAGLSILNFSQKIASKFNDDKSDAIEEIVKELFRLDSARDDLDVSPIELGDMIVASALEDKSKEFSLTDQEARLLGERITKLFEVRKNLSLTSKAITVSTDHQRVFLSTRLFTDIRPVFSEDTTSVAAATLVHNLVIHYTENDDHKDFHIALDASDIEALRRMLDRADKKAALLQSLVDRSKVSYLTL